jgi:hypothetical protein
MSEANTYPAGELASAGKHGNGAGNIHYYKVEVRTTYHEPAVIGGFVVDHIWRNLPVIESSQPWAANIQVNRANREALNNCGLMTRTVAEAHRWAFLADLEAHRPLGSLCIETRLVKVNYSFSYRTEEKGVTEPTSNAEWGQDSTVWRSRRAQPRRALDEPALEKDDE